MFTFYRDGLFPGKAARFPGSPRYRGLSWFSKAIPGVGVGLIVAKISGRQNAPTYIGERPQEKDTGLRTYNPVWQEHLKLSPPESLLGSFLCFEPALSDR